MIQFLLQTQLEIDRALEADPTVYEYDSIYDTMQEKKAQTASIRDTYNMYKSVMDASFVFRSHHVLQKK
jgi:hypothetical protein